MDNTKMTIHHDLPVKVVHLNRNQKALAFENLITRFVFSLGNDSIKIVKITLGISVF